MTNITSPFCHFCTNNEVNKEIKLAIKEITFLENKATERRNIIFTNKNKQKFLSNKISRKTNNIKQPRGSTRHGSSK